MKQPVFFYYHDVQFTFSQRNRLKAFLVKLVKTETYKRVEELNYIFCTDEYLLQINQQFLQHDEYTDIVTFDMSDDKNSLAGEIYISIDRIRENAKLNQTGFNNELHRVIFHGLLHLCGFKDKTSTQVKQMRAKEEEYLSKYFR